MTLDHTQMTTHIVSHVSDHTIDTNIKQWTTHSLIYFVGAFIVDCHNLFIKEKEECTTVYRHVDYSVVYLGFVVAFTILQLQVYTFLWQALQ